MLQMIGDARKRKRGIVAEALTPADSVIVVFGGNGDLARRKLLPALYHLAAEGMLPNDYRIIGNSRSEFSDEQFDHFAREAIEEFGRCPIDEEIFKTFADKLTYVSHEFQPGDTGPLKDEIHKAERELGGTPRRLFYLSVPPPAFGTITEAIGEAGLNERAVVVYEKPFGLDMDSFRALNEVVHDVLDESQVYRIDHFLGKEAVQNILALRFANGMFEPVWNRSHIDHVQVDVPEELGIGTRAGFYEQTGALRDMIVTHLLQVMSFVAMEPPYALEPKPLADETAKVFESMVPLASEDVVRGQYEGYVQEQGVKEGSETETFVAARVHLDNWRWAGVPFFLRTGKRLKRSYQAVTLAFKEPPRQMFREDQSVWFEHDHLTFRLGPDEGVSVTFLAKKPGPGIELGPASMDFRYEGSFGSELIEAYERLLHDALTGDRTLFTRGDGVERTWEVFEKVLRDPPPVHPYQQGSWGPKEADELIAPHRWHVTKLNRSEDETPGR
jgi:glucose-6-phosphate 1-dehydrogenase